MDFDEVFPYIGDFGVYQIFLSCLIGVLSIHCGYQSIALNFLAPPVDHWCKIDRLRNFTFAQQKYISIPYEAKQSGGYRYSQCKRFDYNYSALTEEKLFQWNRTVMNLTNTVSCKSWVYDLSEFANSATVKYNLVCDRSLMVQLAGTIYLAGMFVGAVTSGGLSDRFGRKRIMQLSMVLMIATGVGGAFSPNYAAFVIVRFLVSVGAIAAYTCGFVIYMEIIGPKWRMPLGVTYQIWFSFGFMLVSGFSYSVRDFLKLQLVMTLPMVVILVASIWLIPESPRWLIANGKDREALIVVQRIATVNNKTLPDTLDLSVKQKVTEHEEGEKRVTVLDLFKTPNLRKITLILYLVWFTSTLMYYGLSLNVSSLSGSVFLNNFISGLLEVPANLICLALMAKVGRKYSISAGMLFASITMFGTIPLLYRNNLSGLRTALNLLGKAGVTVAFSGVYVWSAELFPTVLRNVGIGSASTVSRISGMAAPFVGGPLRKVWLPLPSVVFGIFSGVTGIAALFNPETLNRPLPETIKEAETFGRKVKKTSRGIRNKGFTLDHELQSTYQSTFGSGDPDSHYRKTLPH